VSNPDVGTPSVMSAGASVARTLILNPHRGHGSAVNPLHRVLTPASMASGV
jgi:hypothetical protein